MEKERTQFAIPTVYREEGHISKKTRHRHTDAHTRTHQRKDQTNTQETHKLRKGQITEPPKDNEKRKKEKRKNNQKT